jgi:hypothetical protein
VGHAFSVLIRGQNDRPEKARYYGLFRLFSISAVAQGPIPKTPSAGEKPA